MIKLQLEGEDKPTLYTPEKFEELMQVKFLPCLAFQNAKIQKTIEKKCVQAIEEGNISRKQRWLGVYYAEEIAQGWSPDLTIRYIDPILGYGVFTNQKFEPGDFVSEYTGVLKKHRLFFKEGNNYLFYYYIKKKWNSSYFVDAGDCGNYSRFINHSDKGNLEPLYVLSGGVIHILLVATKRIPIGGQLCYDYGDIYWKKREKPLRVDP
jgi:hypothetical protein